MAYLLLNTIRCPNSYSYNILSYQSHAHKQFTFLYLEFSQILSSRNKNDALPQGEEHGGGADRG